MKKFRLLDLPHGHQTVIDEDDFAIVESLTLYRGMNGYVYFSLWRDGKSNPRTLHSLFVHAPRGMHVDHINGDKLDNRRDNLRVVTTQKNQVNRKKRNRNNTSGVRGVSYVPNISFPKPWRVQITENRKNHHVGLFATKEEAIAARRAAELLYFGEMCP